MGEIGLGGQIRSIPQLDLRLKEAAKLGFKKAIVPKGQSYSENLGLEILPVGKLIEAIMAIIPEN